MTNTTTDWAAVLASLSGDELRRALLELSDEDFLREPERAWLREAALRPDVLSPENKEGDLKGYYWSMQDNRAEAKALVRPDLIRRMGAVSSNDEPSEHGKFTRYRRTKVLAWLDLLDVLENKP